MKGGDGRRGVSASLLFWGWSVYTVGWGDAGGGEGDVERYVDHAFDGGFAFSPRFLGVSLVSHHHCRDTSLFTWTSPTEVDEDIKRSRDSR